MCNTYCHTECSILCFNDIFYRQIKGLLEMHHFWPLQIDYPKFHAKGALMIFWSKDAVNDVLTKLHRNANRLAIRVQIKRAGYSFWTSRLERTHGDKMYKKPTRISIIMNKASANSTAIKRQKFKISKYFQDQSYQMPKTNRNSDTDVKRKQQDLKYSENIY